MTDTKLYRPFRNSLYIALIQFEHAKDDKTINLDVDIKIKSLDEFENGTVIDIFGGKRVLLHDALKDCLRIIR